MNTKSSICNDKRKKRTIAIGSFIYAVMLWLTYSILNVQHRFPELKEIYRGFNGYRAEHSFIVILIALAVFLILTRTEVLKVKIRPGMLYALFAILFGVANASGQNMYFLDTLFLGHGLKWDVLYLLGILCYSIAFFLLSYLFVEYLFPWCVEDETESPPNYKRVWGCSFLIIFGCWLIWLIAYYPATVDYDSEWQLCTYLGYWERSNHHPWFATCVLGICYQLGKSIYNDNFGMFLYILPRSIILSAIYARCVLFLKQEGIRNEVCYSIALFFAVTPVWGAYAKQPFKDTFCAGLFCWFIIRTIILIKEIDKKEEIRTISCALFALSGLMTALFRSNYYYVMIIAVILIAAVMIVRKEHALKIGILFLGIFGYMFFNFYITNYAGVVPTESREALSIPFQQTARTVKYHGAEMSQKERLGIDGLLNFEAIGENYCPGFADPVKDTAKEYPTKDELLGYFSVWAKQSWKYRHSYIEAFIADSFGYYAFTDEFSGGALGNYGMVILDDINKDRDVGFDTLFDFNYCDKMNRLRSFLETYYHYWHNIPVISLTNIIPVYTWLIFLIILYLLIRKKPLLIIPSLVVITAILTCIASPVNGSFRYFIPVAASTPALLACVNYAYEDKNHLKQ